MLKLTILLLCSITAAAQNHSHTSDLAAIQQLEQADAAAAKVNDVDTLTSLWTDDGVLIQPMAAPVTGKSAIHDLLLKQRQMSGKVEVLAYDEDWQERQINGDHAFEWGTISVKLRLPNAKEIGQRVYAGRYLSKSPNGRWHFARVVITPAGKP